MCFNLPSAGGMSAGDAIALAFLRGDGASGAYSNRLCKVCGSCVDDNWMALKSYLCRSGENTSGADV